MGIIKNESAYVPSKGWAEMIRKVYEIDPLLCQSCGGLMSVVSFIEEPKTIDRIIRHLELTFEAERPPPESIFRASAAAFLIYSRAESILYLLILML